MRHEYSHEELCDLKSIYDESGEAGLSRDEMRALRRAGMLTQDLPPAPEPEPPHEDTLADYQAICTPEPKAPEKPAEPEPTPAETTTGDNNSDENSTYAQVYRCWQRMSAIGRPTERGVARELGKTTSTIHHHIHNLVINGYLRKDPLRERDYVLTDKPFTPAEDRKAKYSHDTLSLVRDEVKALQADGVPFDARSYADLIAERLGKKPKTVLNKFPQLRDEGVLPKARDPFRNTTKPATRKKETTTMTTTPVQEQKPEAKPEEPRTVISQALTGIFDAVSTLQRTAFQNNDKVVYGFATKLLTGELMDIKANYSKDAK